MKKSGIYAKLIVALIVALMATALVGCGNNSNVTQKPLPEITENNVTTDAPAAEEPTTEETVTLVPAPTKDLQLLSPDGTKVIQEFDLPEGYTLVSDASSNNIKLIGEFNCYELIGNITSYGLFDHSKDFRNVTYTINRLKENNIPYTVVDETWSEYDEKFIVPIEIEIISGSNSNVWTNMAPELPEGKAEQIAEQIGIDVSEFSTDTSYSRHAFNLFIKGNYCIYTVLYDNNIGIGEGFDEHKNYIEYTNGKDFTYEYYKYFSENGNASKYDKIEYPNVNKITLINADESYTIRVKVSNLLDINVSSDELDAAGLGSMRTSELNYEKRAADGIAAYIVAKYF